MSGVVLRPEHSAGVKELCILHFNDVYNIEPQQKQGGAAHFASMFDACRDEEVRAGKKRGTRILHFF